MYKDKDLNVFFEKNFNSITKKPLKNTHSPMEVHPDSMTTIKRILFRPNNYRRELKIRVYKDSTQNISNGNLSATLNIPMENININKRTKIISIKNYKGITIQIFKNHIIGIHSQNIIGGHKETYLLEGTTTQIDTRITQIKDHIRKKIDEGIKYLAKKLGVYIQFKRPIWMRYENWIKGDEFIDKIPRETIIHDTVFKKVYGEGIEFIGGKGEEPGVKIKTYLKNRVLEDFAPEIAESINSLGSIIEKKLIDKFLPAIDNLAENMDTHVQVMKNINKNQLRFNKLLKNFNAQKKLKDFR